MTENKRFILDDCGTVIDMQTRDTFDYVVDVIDLLNAFNNENEQLKQQIIELEKEVNALSDGEADWLIEEML